jgi:hypothetical protein
METKIYKTKNGVKSYMKPIFPILVCVLLAYTSCRKDSVTAPTPAKPTNAALSTQIALNLSKSLAGSFGGVNLKDGVNVSVADHLGPHTACGCTTSNTLCGFYTDSLVNYNATIVDTTIHTGGNLKFYFNCIDGKLSGYSAYDSLNTVRTTPQSVSTYKVQQWYTIKSLDAQNEFIGVSGTNDLHTSITYTGNATPEIGGAFYELTDLKIDVTNKDILSGTATFASYGSNWDIKGTITFLGNHQADVTANGVTTHVTLTF